MPLTNAVIRNAKPKKKAYKIADVKSLYLFVDTQGSKYWRFKNRFARKEKVLALDIYPDNARDSHPIK